MKQFKWPVCNEASCRKPHRWPRYVCLQNDTNICDQSLILKNRYHYTPTVSYHTACKIIIVYIFRLPQIPWALDMSCSYSSVPPGYNPTSASAALKELPDSFSFPLLSVSLFSPTGCKHKPASVLRNCPSKQTKISFVSRLLKITCWPVSIECDEPQLIIF